MKSLAHKRLLWSGQGRKAETLERFFAELVRGIQAICCDMWAPCVAVIKAQAPEAILVFDKFHLIRHLRQAVDQVRKEESVELKKTDPELLKGTKYLWLMNSWKHTPQQKQRLGYLEKMNLKIGRADILAGSLGRAGRTR